ncbi:MAG TPA: hypothetical protein PLP22_03855 [Candidatus Competibacter sp.]|nr:hypothetical protein [Candidatus Competibacteraceae bacterium]HRE53910.1 hypothetical protein [Candidatus Competibacter sp.]HUM93925.1 hypothetical protein [Candidatus Competibacter sp.]
MSLSVKADKALIWDKLQSKMVTKIRVTVSLVGNQGSVFHEAGPLYVENAPEIFEAIEVLRARLIKVLLFGVG